MPVKKIVTAEMSKSLIGARKRFERVLYFFTLFSIRLRRLKMMESADESGLYAAQSDYISFLRKYERLRTHSYQEKNKRGRLPFPSRSGIET